MKCFQCKYVKVCMAQADMLGQVFDVNYDGEYCCTDFTPFTNADRIRAMSDEEIAELILDWVQTGACNDFGVPVTGNCNGKCVECIVEWLKHPAEEET